MTNGRGGWSKVGMPPGASGYYQLLTPVNVGTQPELGPDYQAVNYGVRAIQNRINHLGVVSTPRPPTLAVDGHFGSTTDTALRWAQKKLGVAADGQFGPRTSVAFFWPVIQNITADATIQHTVGGICAHESSFDPGAVGYADPDDHGLVQINAPANPAITVAQAFDYRTAFSYCAKRIAAALATFQNLDVAICSYASPLWAQQWAATGHSPNQQMTDYVNYVRSWVPPA